MEPSLWTGFFGTLAPEQAMRELAEAGFAHAEISCEMAVDPAANWFSRAWMERLHRAARACGLETPQVHYPITTLTAAAASGGGWDPEREADLAHPSRSRRDREMRCVQDLLAVCPAAGIRILVIHPGGSRGVAGEAEHRRVRELNREAFASLAPIAASYGVTLALENMGRVDGTPQFGCRMSELYDLIEVVAAPNIGVCLDTSHAFYMAAGHPGRDHPPRRPACRHAPQRQPRDRRRPPDARLGRHRMASGPVGPRQHPVRGLAEPRDTRGNGLPDRDPPARKRVTRDGSWRRCGGIRRAPEVPLSPPSSA